MEKWEYRTLKIELSGFMGGVLKTDTFDETINEAGEEGLELVSCFATTGGQGYGREAVAVFKRKK